MIIFQVKLNKRPWHARWERAELQGVQDLSDRITEKMQRQRKMHEKPWEKYDLMKQYRSRVNDEEEAQVMSEVYAYQTAIDKKRGPRKMLQQEILKKFMKQR